MAVDAFAPELSESTGEADDTAKDDAPPPDAAVRSALVVGLVIVIALIGLVGWLGLRAYQARSTGAG